MSDPSALRHGLLVLLLATSLATSGASAQTADFFLGRPPSAGVVRGGGFGVGGFDYYGDGRRETLPERHRRVRIAPARIAPGPTRPAPPRAAAARSGRP